MLYNGVELADINEVWTDKTTYPYAIVEWTETEYCNGAKLCQLVVLSKAGAVSNGFYTVDGDYGRMIWNLYETQELADMHTSFDGQPHTAGVWEFSSERTSGGEGVHGSPDWANHDVFNADGSLYLAGSEPINGDEKYIILAGTLAAIGLAIRKLKGNNKLYKPTEMPAAIEPDVVTAIDYSAWDSGKFTETLDNGAKLDYAVEFDGDKPVKVTRADGSEVSVDWGDS